MRYTCSVSIFGKGHWLEAGAAAGLVDAGRFAGALCWAKATPASRSATIVVRNFMSFYYRAISSHEGHAGARMRDRNNPGWNSQFRAKAPAWAALENSANTQS